MAKIGDKVTFYFWAGGHEVDAEGKLITGKLHSCPATVTAVIQEPDAPIELDLDCEIPDEICASEGYAKKGRYRQRTIADDTVHASGSWTP